MGSGVEIGGDASVAASSGTLSDDETIAIIEEITAREKYNLGMLCLCYFKDVDVDVDVDILLDFSNTLKAFLFILFIKFTLI